MELVSVIVPVYNAERELPACLDCLLAQTHDALQVVLVDDGSTDGSARLCDEAAAADERVNVIHRQNGGPASARNAGLDAVCGSWIAFVDADDAVEPDYLEILLAVAHETDAQLVASDCIIEENGARRRFGMVVADMLYTTRDDLWQDFLAGRVPWSLWAKLYRADLLSGVRFDEDDYIAEDLDVNARMFAREGLVLATSACTGYTYRVRKGSVDHSFTTRHLRQFEVFERVVQLANSLQVNTTVSAEVFYEERMLNCLRKAIVADALTPDVVAAFKRAIALHRADVLSDPNASAALKLRMHATKLGPKAYAVLNKLYPS